MIDLFRSGQLPWVLFGFLATWGLLYWLLVKRFPLPAIAWKKVDYVWLLLGSFGLVGAAGEVRRLVATAEIGWGREKVRAIREDILRYGFPSELCFPIVRSQFSPPNFDDIVRERAIMCAWIEKARSAVPSVDTTSEAVVPLDTLLVPSVRDPYIQSRLASTKEWTVKYREERTTYRAAVSRAERSSLELTALILAPWLLAGALALRLAKVAGEVRLLRASAQQSETEIHSPDMSASSTSASKR